MGKVFYDLKENDILQEITNKYQLCIIDFYADWCGPCLKLTKEIEDKIKNESFYDKLGKDILFVKINVDIHEELCRIYKIKSIPHIIFYKNGQLQADIIKGNNYIALMNKITELLN
jgi:thioredoxin 1